MEAKRVDLTLSQCALLIVLVDNRIRVLTTELLKASRKENDMLIHNLQMDINDLKLLRKSVGTVAEEAESVIHNVRFISQAAPKITDVD